MLNKQYEGQRKVKVEMVCTQECGNMFDLDSRFQQQGAICIDIHYIFICDQCGKQMVRRITKITEQITETIVE